MTRTNPHPSTPLAGMLLALTLLPLQADAQSRVQYGRITNAVVVTDTSNSARNVGTVVGGTVGLASGSGQSGSNRALRTVGCAPRASRNCSACSPTS